MKKIVSLILLAVMSLFLLTGCWGSGNDKTVNYAYENGARVLVFDVDKTSSYTVDSHKNLVTIRNYSNNKKDSISFNDVYIKCNQFEGVLKIKSGTGISPIKGDYIPDGTVIKINNNNCYINCASGIVNLKNVKVTLNKVSSTKGANGKVTISFEIA